MNGSVSKRFGRQMSTWLVLTTSVEILNCLIKNWRKTSVARAAIDSSIWLCHRQFSKLSPATSAIRAWLRSNQLNFTIYYVLITMPCLKLPLVTIIVIRLETKSCRISHRKLMVKYDRT